MKEKIQEIEIVTRQTVFAATIAGRVVNCATKLDALTLQSRIEDAINIYGIEEEEEEET